MFLALSLSKPKRDASPPHQASASASASVFGAIQKKSKSDKELSKKVKELEKKAKELAKLEKQLAQKEREMKSGCAPQLGSRSP